MRRSPRAQRSWRIGTIAWRASPRQRLIAATAQRTERLNQMCRPPKGNGLTAGLMRVGPDRAPRATALLGMCRRVPAAAGCYVASEP